MLKLTGFDDCLVGRIEQFGREPVAAYCVDRIIDKMVTEWGLTADEAWEYHEYNQLGAYAGEGTPVYLHSCDIDQLEEYADA